VNESFGYFFQLLPWNFITKFYEGVVVQKADGILQRTFAFRAPDIDSSGTLEINSLSVRVNDVAKRLGSGWAFQFEAQRFQIREYPQSYFDSLAPYLIDRERDFSFKTAGRHFESSYYLTFTWKPPSENVKKLTSMFIQSGSSGGGGESIKQNVDFFVNESNSVASLLSSQMLLVPLNNYETVSYLHSTVSFKRHPIYFPHTRILLDRIIPDSALDNSFPMKLGDHFIPIVGINDFPDETYPAILDSLNRARLEYRWVTRYICLDKDAGAKEARKKEKAHRGSRKSFLQTLSETTSGEAAKAVNHGAGVKEQDSIDAGIEIETDITALGFLTTCVMVWDTSLNTAKDKADLVKTIVNSRGFTCKDETFNSLESFQAMMPGQMYASYRALPVMSNTMSHIVPLSSVWAGMPYNEHSSLVTGVDTPLIVCSTNEGTPFFFNLNVGDVGHSAVWGPTGAGKSTLLNLIEMQFFKYPGSLVIVFDKGRSCRQSCLAAGGHFYEPAGENSAGVNFQPLADLDTDRDMLDAIDFIEACIAANGYAVPPLMTAAVKEALSQMIGIPRRRRTITTFLQYINYKDPDTGMSVVKDMLGDYSIGGKFGRIFDSNSMDLSLDSRFLAIEMEALMNRGLKCIVPALVYLFNLIEKKFDGRLSLLVLDEAWLFLKNETFSGKIAEWLKVLRKKNVYVVFATQDVMDVINSPLKTTIIQQCPTKIYLADPSADTPAMAAVYREFGLTDAEIDLLAAASMKRDYFYTSPNGRRLFQLDLGKLSLSLIGTPDHPLLDRLASQYEPGSALCAEILAAKGIVFGKLLDKFAPVNPVPELRKIPFNAPSIQAPENDCPSTDSIPQEIIHNTEITETSSNLKITQFLEAVASLPERKKKDGSGRAASSVAGLFNVSLSTVYQTKKILKYGSPDLVDSLRRGNLPVKTAYKRLLKERGLSKPPLQPAAV
jgi:type IV secretion system protein VirB4